MNNNMTTQQLRDIITDFEIPRGSTYPEMGNTGYLDVNPNDTMTTCHGLDQVGRVFLHIRVEYTRTFNKDHEDYDEEIDNDLNGNTNIIIHQRYDNDEQIVVASLAPSDLFTWGALVNTDAEILRRILSGEEVEWSDDPEFVTRTIRT